MSGGISHFFRLLSSKNVLDFEDAARRAKDDSVFSFERAKMGYVSVDLPHVSKNMEWKKLHDRQTDEKLIFWYKKTNFYSTAARTDKKTKKASVFFNLADLNPAMPLILIIRV